MVINREVKPLNRDAGVDIARVISIFYIVGYWHMMDYLEFFRGYFNYYTVFVTQFVLAVFIYISGLLLSRKLLKLTFGEYYRFLKSRLLRVYPLYTISLILFVVFGLASWEIAIKAFFALSMFFGPSPVTLWFMAMLIVFYILFPAIVGFANTDKPVIYTVVCLVLLYLVFVFIYFAGYLDYRFLIYFPAFVVGIISGRYRLDLIKSRVVGVICFLGLLSIFLYSSSDVKEFSLACTAVTTLLPVYFVALCRLVCSNAITTVRIFSVLSFLSFAMYLFHRPIYMVIKKIYFPDHWLAQLLYLVLVAFPVIVLVSYYIQKYNDTLIRYLSFRVNPP